MLLCADEPFALCKNVLRGLHYQVGRPQGKLVRVVRGRVLMWQWISAWLAHVWERLAEEL